MCGPTWMREERLEMKKTMQAVVYREKGRFTLEERPVPELLDPRDAVVRVTLASICSSDLHIKGGFVPRAKPGIVVGHEMVGVVEQVGEQVTRVAPGDRVAVNVETFCGTCFFCQRGAVNNCTDPNGGWALGCRIDGGQAEYVRVPYADQGLTVIPDRVSDRQALFAGDVLATGYWAARISEIRQGDTVLILGAGPTGICTMLCAMLHHPHRIIICDPDPARLRFVREHYPDVLTITPEHAQEFVQLNSPHGGADVIVCEAFVGNVILKLYEGVGATMISMIKKGMMSSLRSKIGALLIKPALKSTLKSFDASQYGGAPLLGLKGLVVKTHGSSKANEVKNSIIQCIAFKEQAISEKIGQCLSPREEDIKEP